MTAGAVATASTCSSVTKLGVSTPVDTGGASTSAMGIFGNSFPENQADMTGAQKDAGLPYTPVAFGLGEQVHLLGLRTCQYNQQVRPFRHVPLQMGDKEFIYPAASWFRWRYQIWWLLPPSQGILSMKMNFRILGLSVCNTLCGAVGIAMAA